MPGPPGLAKAASGVAGAVGLGALALWYQLFRRPLPRTSGVTRVDGLEAPVDILRDRWGVPHIRARGAFDLAFGLGFCHGQDRLWQLEFFRRVTAGRLSEFAGADTLHVDRAMRTVGFHRVAQRETEMISDTLLQRLRGYAAGINAAIESAQALPIEFQIARLEPEPWTVTHLLASAKLLSVGLSTNWEMELYRAWLARAAGPERAARLEPQYPRSHPVVVSPGEVYGGDGVAIAEQIARVREAIGLAAPTGGSNNWVVSGDRSVTGRPLVACDPHLSTTIPSLLYEADLLCDDYHVRGATLPHSPDPVYSQTHHTAWGFTNSMADIQDLFVERFNPDDDRLYEFRGEWRPAQVLDEEIQVKGRSRPDKLTVRLTHHGPIINEALGATAEEPLALAWTALQYPLLTDASYRASHARTGEELIAATEDHVAPPLNMVWADREGNIGFKLIGKLPIRAGGSPDVPKPGWTGEFEWEGTIPFDELPSVVNPTAGFIVTANNRIAGDDYPYHISSEYMTGYRAQRIEEMLAERERHSLEDFARMQTDLLSRPGIETVHRLSRIRPGSQRETRAIERLKSWDGRLSPESIAATIVHAFTLSFGQAIIGAAVADQELVERYLNKSVVGILPYVSSPWRFQSRLLELWEEGDESWFASPQHPEGRAWDDVALESLTRALDSLERRFGEDQERWRWGRVHGVEFSHPFGESNRFFRRIFCRHIEAGGASESVFQSGYTPTEPFTGIWAPVYRMLADVGDASRSRWQASTGQSGQPGSRHFDDRIPDWLAGRTNPVLREEQDVRDAGDARLLRLEPN